MIRSALLAVVAAALVAAVALLAGTSAAFAEETADSFRLKAFDRPILFIYQFNIDRCARVQFKV